MKRVAVISCLLLALAGCGGTPSSSGFSPPRPVTWKDGDPLVPVCGTSFFNCKKSYTVHDRTTGSLTTLSIMAIAYTPPTPDDYEFRAEGFDWQGQSISSPYVAIPK